MRRPVPLLLMAVVAALGVMALPEFANACTVCMGGQEEASRKAFVGTTAFLTFFPLLVLAIGVTLFVRRTLAREQAETEARDRMATVAELSPPIR